MDQGSRSMTLHHQITRGKSEEIIRHWHKKEYLGMILKIQAIKPVQINEVTIKLQSCCMAKKTMNKAKRQLTE